MSKRKGSGSASTAFGRSRATGASVTETLVLSVASAALGLGVARVMTRLLLALLAHLPIPVDVSVPLEWRVRVFTIGVCLSEGLLTGLTPAWQAVRSEVRSMAASSARGLTTSSRLRFGSVAGQVALLAAGLFMRGLQRGSTVDSGFQSHGALT